MIEFSIFVTLDRFISICIGEKNTSEIPTTQRNHAESEYDISSALMEWLFPNTEKSK